MTAINFGRFLNRSANNVVLSAYDGPKTAAGEDAKIGDSVASWVDKVTGRVFAALPGTVATLVNSDLRPDKKVVRVYEGGFRHVLASGVNDIGAAGNGDRYAISWTGSLAPLTDAVSIPVAWQSRTNGATEDVFGLRSQYTSQGFQGTSSLAFADNSASSSVSRYGHGAPAQWHNLLMHRGDYNGDVGVGYYSPQLIATPPPSVSLTPHANASLLAIGGVSDVTSAGAFVQTSQSYIDYEHVAWWDGIDAPEAQELADVIQKSSASVRWVSLGDSRVERAGWNGTFQRYNSAGYLFDEFGQSGLGIDDMVALVDTLSADTSTSLKYDVMSIYTGSNSLGNSPTSSTAVVEFEKLRAFIEGVLNRDIAQLVVVLNDTPRNNGDANNRPEISKFSHLIESQLLNHSRVIVVDSWRAVQDSEDRLSLDPTVPSDDTHFDSSLGPDGNPRVDFFPGYERIVPTMLGIVQERLGHRDGNYFTSLNAASLVRGIAEREDGLLDQTFTDVGKTNAKLESICTRDDDGNPIPLADKQDASLIMDAIDQTQGAVSNLHDFDPLNDRVMLTAANLASLFSGADAQTQFAELMTGLLEGFDDPNDAAVMAIASAVWAFQNRSLTEPVETDAASRTASQADVAALATADQVAAVNGIVALLTNPDNQPVLDAISGLATAADLGTAATAIEAVREAVAKTLKEDTDYDLTNDPNAPQQTDQVAAVNFKRSN